MTRIMDEPPLERIRMIARALTHAPKLKDPLLDETMEAIRQSGELILEAVAELEAEEHKRAVMESQESCNAMTPPR